MNKPVKYSIFLLVLGIVAGLLLAYVNSITAPVIAERKKAEVKAALIAYFDYDEFSENKSGEYSNLDGSIREIYYAFNENGDLEAIIYQTVANGYGGEVVSLVGIKADGKLDNVYMISGDKETSGIGSNVLKHDFKVENDPVNNVTYEIYSGATVTSTAVVTGMEAAVKHFKTVDLGGISNE